MKQHDRYHHGDLANALTVAATDLARSGGPEAVVLREAARKVGVSATAAYRHFSGHGDLIHAVKEAAQRDLAASMEAELAERMVAAVAETQALADPGAEALRRLRALGRGYLRFALAEPGLFRTAFCRADKGHDELTAAMLEAPAFAMLTEALDALLAAGLMPPSRRPFAETAAWSGVHGLAMLLIDGPLSAVPEDQRLGLIEGVLDMIVSGVCCPQPQ